MLHPWRSKAAGTAGQFRARVDHPKAMADLLRNGFIWTPFCPDLDQTLFEPNTNLFVPFLFMANGHLGHASDGTLEAGKRRKHLFYLAKLFTGTENTRFVVPGSPQCFKVLVLSSGKLGACSEGTPPVASA